jgi:fructoselysine-6-phosphate deglycase
LLNFDVERFVRIQHGAIAQWPVIRDAVQKALDRGAENLFLLGSGGAAILMHPAAQLLRTQSRFPVQTELSAELLETGSPHLGPQSLVVIPSLSGTTAESVAMMNAAKAAGASVITLVGHADTPLGRGGAPAVVNFAEDDTSSESFYMQSLLVALAILQHRGELDGVDGLVRDFGHVPEALVKVKEGFEQQAERIAEAFRNEPYHIFTGAGSTWPQAFYYGMCILEEMQWIRTRPVHASDFFHGTLELVEPGVSVVLLKGEDACRPLADRVEVFARTYTDKLTVLDSASFDLPGVSPAARRLLSPVILATALERVSAHLEVKRNHPLTTRRYYKRVPY